jgi:hypothetical protein
MPRGGRARSVAYTRAWPARSVARAPQPQYRCPWPAGLPALAQAKRQAARAAMAGLLPVVRWQVDAAAVEARVCRFAGGRAAITDAADEVYLAVVGVGTGMRTSYG